MVDVNDAGKIMFSDCQLKAYLEWRFAELPFVNADEIQRTRGLTTDPQDAYQAARMAAKRRAELLKQQGGFVAEIVFSHPSEIGLTGVSHLESV
jgi:predicted ABC-type ATPase